jgi:lipoic acid synthetase
VDRGGDITYHGPGQLVGYPVLHLAGKRGGGMADTVAYVDSVEQLIIDVLADLGLSGAGRVDGQPGVWLDPDGTAARKIAAVGVKLTRGRSMHGFALNVNPDLDWFGRIVPCGIADKAVTSLAAEGIDVEMRTVVDAVAERAAAVWGAAEGVAATERADVVWRNRDTDLAPFSRGAGPGATPGRPSRSADGTSSVRLLGRLAEAGVAEGIDIAERKPEWMRVRLDTGPEYLRLKKVMRDLDLVTVCEEAGCPNIFDCWNDGTATFMINGERCTRACGFCLVDTRRPEPLDTAEPERVANAVEAMELSYAVITSVARDDLADGGARGFADTIAAVRERRPDCRVEVLIPDCKGDPAALGVIFAARPDVLNHNIETVPRLQRAARPSAGYARSLSVLARAHDAALLTKSSIIVGLGETRDEVIATMADLRSVGVDIVTIGQYLRPTTNHLPVARWVHPDEFAELAEIGATMGLGHVESSPLTRSSYHARQAADGV